MSRLSGDRLAVADRGVVEPIAALVAVLVVGMALGLYVGVVDDVSQDVTEGPDDAALVMDRIERDVTRGGVVRPSRLHGLAETRTPTLVELEAEEETWRVGLGATGTAEPDWTDRRSDQVLERRVTVRIGPGRNVAGTLRVVFHE